LLFLSLNLTYMITHKEQSIIFLLSTSCPEVEEFAFYTLYYIRVCKSKTYLILKNIFNRVQN